MGLRTRPVLFPLCRACPSAGHALRGRFLIQEVWLGPEHKLPCGSSAAAPGAAPWGRQVATAEVLPPGPKTADEPNLEQCGICPPVPLSALSVRVWWVETKRIYTEVAYTYPQMWCPFLGIGTTCDVKIGLCHGGNSEVETLFFLFHWTL